MMKSDPPTEEAHCTKPRPGRPPRISRKDIAEAALAIGFDKLTLPAIAKRLGVDHSSLYRHVRGRDDILLAAANLAIDRLDWENASRDWRAYLSHAAEAVWDMYEAYPGLDDTIRRLEATPPSAIRAFVKACRQLEEFGFSVESSVVVMDSIMDMTSDASSGWRRMGMASKKGRTIGESIQHSWEIEPMRMESENRYIMLMSGIISGSPKAWWKRKLGVLLDGAEMLLSREGASKREA